MGVGNSRRSGAPPARRCAVRLVRPGGTVTIAGPEPCFVHVLEATNWSYGLRCVLHCCNVHFPYSSRFSNRVGASAHAC